MLLRLRRIWRSALRASARSWRALEHVNIVRHMTPGVTSDGLPYLAMSTLPGHP